MKGYQRSYLFAVTLLSAACGSHSLSHKASNSGPHVDCENERLCQIEADITLRNQELEAAKNKGNHIEVQGLRLELNYLKELKDASKKDQNELIEQVESKYDVLRNLFSIETQNAATKRNFNGAIAENSRPNPDEAYPKPFVSVYHPLVLEEVKRVNEDFGELYIKETLNSSGNPTFKSVKVKRPWSGYWLPFRDRTLYEGKNSPLGKMDQIVQYLGYDSTIAETQKKTFGIYKADGWEGLCDAWALASVVTPEPKKSRNVYGVNFSVADLKALLTFTHAKYPYIQYGITYRGDADTDGTLQDLKPEAFHQVVTKVLGEQKRALIVDETAGVEIWNKPLYSYRWRITKDPEYDFAYLVKAFPLLVKQKEQNSSSPTHVDDILAPTYNYRLYVDKSVKKDGKFRVIAGQWLGKSRSYHPGNVKYPILNGSIGSHNQEFNKYLDIYKRIFLTQ
ncbi:MAG: hypothetical protein HRU09_16955 [Oligoflexales bacterium]|nr:hypothetical protein [Oligoflexales bacterium]